MLSTSEVLAAYEALKSRVNEPCPQSLIRFSAGKDIFGYVEPKTAVELASYTGCFRLTETLSLSSSAQLSFTTRTQAFALAHEQLLLTGKAKPSRELLEVRLSVLDQPSARAPRGVVRALGLLTQSVHLVAWKGEEVILSQRSADRAVGAGLWDTTAAGMVAAGEALTAALYREAWEEAGLISHEMTLTKGGSFVYRAKVPEGWMQEEMIVFDAKLKDSALPMNRDGSVQRFQAKTLDEVLVLIQENKMMLGSAVCILESWLRRHGAAPEDSFMRYPYFFER